MIHWFCYTFVKVLTRIIYRHRVYGIEYFPPNGAIIASNHASYLDPMLVGVSCPRKIHFLARDSLFRFPPFGWLIRELCTHPVHQGKGNLHAFKIAMELIESSKKVVIFPEGSRSPDGKLHKGQLGVGMLVQRTQCKVIPIYTHGTYEIWRAHKFLPKPWGKTACVFGRPLSFEHIDFSDKKGAQVIIVKEVMDKIAELKQWYLEGAKGSPP